MSVASVSRALNDLPTVTAETRERVRAVAERLRYVPHAGARSLSLSRTGVIGVVLPDLHGEFFSELVRGMDRATQDRGYQMLVCTAHGDPGRIRHAISAMHGRVDGLLLMAPQTPAEALAALTPPGTPTVLLNSRPSPGHPALRVDNAAGAAAAARHLVALGRRRLVHVAGPVGNMDAGERLDGFTVALAAAAPGLKCRVIAGDFQEASGAAAVERLLAAGTPFDAVFAANDGMAVGALSALKAAGRSTPGDVAVVGFDDVPLARYLELTTLRVPMGELGRMAVDRLCDAVADPSAPVGDALVGPELVVRASTGAPA